MDVNNNYNNKQTIIICELDKNDDDDEYLNQEIKVENQIQKIFKATRETKKKKGVLLLFFFIEWAETICNQAD